MSDALQVTADPSWTAEDAAAVSRAAAARLAVLPPLPWKVSEERAQCRNENCRVTQFPRRRVLRASLRDGVCSQCRANPPEPNAQQEMF